MPRTIELTVYKYSELSENAKERARQDYASACEYSWADEALASLKALAEHFNGKLKNWSIDWGGASYSSASFDMPEMKRKDIAERLALLGEYNRQPLHMFHGVNLVKVSRAI